MHLITTDTNVYEVYVEQSADEEGRYIIGYFRNGQPQWHTVPKTFTEEEIVTSLPEIFDRHIIQEEG